MADLVPAQGLAAWRAFLRAHADAVSRIEADLARAGLIPLTWYDLLVGIQLAPGHQLRMKDIAAHLLLTRSNATRLVDRLERRGLIRRKRLAGDRRGTAAVLTVAGRRALRHAWPVYARGIKLYFLAPLSPVEIRSIATALSKVQLRAD